MKLLSKTLLITYLLTLVWLVLFKFSFDLPSVLLNYQSRSLNLIPFADVSGGNLREVIDNFIVFVPFGLLLGVNFKQSTLWRRLAIIFSFSLTAELAQYLLAIGTTDITDVIMNTAGGLAGLMMYDLTKKYLNNDILDRLIVVIGLILLVLLLIYRVLFIQVRY